MVGDYQTSVSQKLGTKKEFEFEPGCLVGIEGKHVSGSIARIRFEYTTPVSLSGGAVAGIVVAIIFIIVLVVICKCCCKKGEETAKVTEVTPAPAPAPVP